MGQGGQERAWWGADRWAMVAQGGRLAWNQRFGFCEWLEPPSGIVAVGTAALVSVVSTSEGSISED